MLEISKTPHDEEILTTVYVARDPGTGTVLARYVHARIKGSDEPVEEGAVARWLGDVEGDAAAPGNLEVTSATLDQHRAADGTRESKRGRPDVGTILRP